MEAFLNWLRLNVLKVLIPPKNVEIIDIIQVILIAYFIYNVILWVKNTRAYSLLKGIFVIVIFIVIANALHMSVIMWLVGNLGLVAVTAMVIIFQPELRKVLEQMGSRKLLGSFFRGKVQEENLRFSDQTINEIVRAAFDMGEVKTGALIVIERDIKLEEFEETGIPIDAVITSQLLINIFEHNTPLHDGAVIARGNRVLAATCYLPLSDNMDISKELGTRHRAGLGISEVSDSLTIIVSEETGKVSYAMNGRLVRGVTASDLKQKLLSIQKLREGSTFASIRKERAGRA